MQVAEKAPPRRVTEAESENRRQRDVTIFAMVVVARKSPARVADHFNLTIGDVRRIVRRVRKSTPPDAVP